MEPAALDRCRWSVICCLISETLLALLQNVVANTLAARDGDNRVLILLGKHEDVADAGSEGATLGVLDVHDLEGTDVLLTASDGTDTALILTPGHDTGGADLELDDILGLASGKVHFDDIVVLGQRVRVPNGTAIVGSNVWDTLGADRHALDLAELELVLFVVLLAVQAMENKAALGVVHHAEVLIGLVDRDDIHEATRVVGVGANLAVDLDEALHQNLRHLLLGEGVFEAVTQVEGRGAQVPPILSSIQCLGALRRFRCFLGPRA